MTYRDDLAALSARHDALSGEVATKTRELENATKLLDEARAKARLPVLDNIRVASPCSADWAKMNGDERVRHCGDCKKNVYNLSDMNREEAETLILAHEGRLCVRYFQRKDGTILLKDCEIGVSKARKRKYIAAGAAALLAVGGAGVAARLLGTSSTDGEHVQGGATAVMGGSGMEPHERMMMGELVKEPAPQIDNLVHEVKGGLAPIRDLNPNLNKPKLPKSTKL